MAKVLLFCRDRLSTSMAGPAIRYWEFANALAKKHDVTLLSSHKTMLQAEKFKILSTEQIPLEVLVKTHEVIVSQVIDPKLAYHAKKHHKKIVLDAYDPLPIESLEYYKHYPPPKKKLLMEQVLESNHFSFSMADRVICASSLQQDLWTGFMMSMGLVTPDFYEKDPTFRSKLGIVPFGMSSEPPKKNGKGLREKFNFRSSDFILLWGGGIWNWFDPLTLIRAVAKISKSRSDIKLVFMGTKHPNPGIPEMKMTQDAIALTKDLEVIDKSVFFNFGWVPYHERQNFLLDADIGVSFHFDNLETRYSFRTRILDYLWAELPILCTAGDFFADLVERKGLGVVVPAESKGALSEKILFLASRPPLLNSCKTQIRGIKEEFYWENVVGGLNNFIEELCQENRKTMQLREVVAILKYIAKRRGPTYLAKSLAAYALGKR